MESNKKVKVCDEKGPAIITAKQAELKGYLHEACHALPWAVEQAKAICCYLTLERGEVCRFGAILNRVFPVFGIF